MKSSRILSVYERNFEEIYVYKNFFLGLMLFLSNSLLFKQQMINRDKKNSPTLEMTGSISNKTSKPLSDILLLFAVCTIYYIFNATKTALICSLNTQSSFSYSGKYDQTTFKENITWMTILNKQIQSLTKMKILLTNILQSRERKLSSNANSTSLD